MSKRHVSMLVLALVLVVGAIFLLLPGQTAREPSDSDRAAMPGLEAAVNDLTRIVTVGAGEEVIATLERGADGWTVQEFSGYGADIDVLRSVLGGLAQARVLEPKTDNPDYYARLGVEDVSAEDAAGVRLDLASDAANWSVIIGNEAPARGGHYLRMAYAAGSLLVDFTGDVPDNAAGWVDTKVVDLLAAEVAEVRIEQPDGETLTARKTSADETDFTLLELPEGRELKSAWSVNSLGSTLSTLDLEAVRRADELSWQGAIGIRALRFDGLEVTAELLRLGDEGDWLRLSASAPVPEAPAPLPAADPDDDAESAVGDVPDDGPVDEVAATGDPAAADDGDLIAAAMAEVVAEADALNARANGWAYRIPAFKAEAMDQRLVDLLREPTDPASDGTDAP